MLSSRMRTARKSRNLTQEGLAERTGLVREMIARYETGKVVPDLSSVIRIADVLDVSLDYLTGRSESSEIVNPSSGVPSNPLPQQNEEELAFTPQQLKLLKRMVEDMLEKKGGDNYGATGKGS